MATLKFFSIESSYHMYGKTISWQYLQKNIIERNTVNLINMRKILEDNKIFLEIISSIFLTLMSIIISYIGVQTDKRGIEIYEKQLEVYEKQLEIMRSDREPSFTVKCEPVEQLEGYKCMSEIYTITNEGGLISGAYLSEINKRIIIRIEDAESKEINTFILPVTGVFDPSDNMISPYDNTNKVFTFYSWEIDKLNKLQVDLQQKLKDLYQEEADPPRVSVFSENIVNVNYINYRNEKCSQKYQFWDTDRMVIIADSRYEDGIGLSGLDISLVSDSIIQDISESIKERAGFLSWAKGHICGTPFSYNKFLEDLELMNHGPHTDIIYALEHSGADWNEHAKETARIYIALMKIESRDELIKKLEEDGFTHEQAIYGADQNGY